MAAACAGMFSGGGAGGSERGRCARDGQSIACPTCAQGARPDASNGGGSKKGLLGLLGLLAVVPLVCLMACGAVFGCCVLSRRRERRTPKGMMTVVSENGVVGTIAVAYPEALMII